MSVDKHQWEYFSKGRIRVMACTQCGDINHSTNADQQCERKKLSDTLLIRSGYRKVALQAS